MSGLARRRSVLIARRIIRSNGAASGILEPARSGTWPATYGRAVLGAGPDQSLGRRSVQRRNDRKSAPRWSIIRYEFPQLGDRGPVKMFWYDGGMRPGIKLPADITLPRATAERCLSATVE